MALIALEYTITNIDEFEAKDGPVPIQLIAIPKCLVCPVVNMNEKINIL